MRLRIAELKESQNAVAWLMTFNEIDMSSLMEMRKRYKDAVLKEHDVKLGSMSAFAKARTPALKEVPAADAAIECEEITHVDLSVAGCLLNLLTHTGARWQAHARRYGWRHITDHQLQRRRLWLPLRYPHHQSAVLGIHSIKDKLRRTDRHPPHGDCSHVGPQTARRARGRHVPRESQGVPRGPAEDASRLLGEGP